LLLTGDKKALNALIESEKDVCKNLIQHLKGRVLTLEVIILLMIHKFGFEVILKHLQEGEYAKDKTLKMCFQSGSKENAFEGIKSYLKTFQEAGILYPHV
jgi:hypothetical protein